MLFWAVDNPAPANYLLISGDRDFSNALHQLRRRGYNILLAQPLEASTAALAAGRSVWSWTSLVGGELLVRSGKSSQLTDGNNMLNTEKTDVFDGTARGKPVFSYTGSLSLINQKLVNSEIFSDDAKTEVGCAQINSNQSNMTRISIMPDGIQESNLVKSSYQQKSVPTKQFKTAPHEFFGTTEPFICASRSESNIFHGNRKPLSTENLCNVNAQSQSALTPDKFLPSNSCNSPFHPMLPRPAYATCSSVQHTQVLAIANLSLSEYPNCYCNHPPNHPNFCQRPVYKPSSTKPPSQTPSYLPQNGNVLPSGKPFYHETWENGSPDSPGFRLLPAVVCKNVSGNDIRMEGTKQPYKYIRGLIGIILFTLDILKREQIIPTEANIANCIRYGDLKYHITDVRKALNYALEQQMIVEQNVGALQLYVGKVEKLWRCVNPIDGSLNQYSEATWDEVHRFLTSSAGRSAIMASECRYEAALILRNACLKELTLGDVHRILHMIITIKRWIRHHHFGWKPIAITVPETISSAGIKAGG